MPIYRTLPIEKCIIDPRYQREKIEPHIERIKKDFDPAEFSVLEASERDDGSFAIFDGQQRLEARKRRVKEGLESPPIKLPALVHTGLTPEKEAELFVRLQMGRRPVMPAEKFRSRVFYKDPIAVAITDITNKHRHRVGVGPGSIQGVVALERAYRRGNLDQTLALMDVWRGDQDSLSANIIDGVSRFLDLYPEVDTAHARKKWAEVSPKTVLRRAGDASLDARGRAGGVLRVLRDEYSDKTHPLPTIDAAVAQRIAAERESGRRYVRVSEEEVLEAVLDLETFQLPQLREKLGGVSRAALTNERTGYLHRLRKRGIVARRYARPEEGETPGQFTYYVVPVTDQRRRRTPRTRPSTRIRVQTNGDRAGTTKRRGKPHPEIIKMIEAVEAGGAEVTESPSGHYVIQAEGKNRVIVKPNPPNPRAVMEEKARVRREGYPV